MDYDEIKDKVNTFYEVLNTTQNRDKVLSAEEILELKESIMILSNEDYADYKAEYEKTKNMNSMEYQYYKELNTSSMTVEDKILYNGKRNTLSDFNIDQNSIQILNNKSNPNKKKLDAFKDDNTSNFNFKI